jgi:hypothetical protein
MHAVLCCDFAQAQQYSRPGDCRNDLSAARSCVSCGAPSRNLCLACTSRHHAHALTSVGKLSFCKQLRCGSGTPSSRLQTAVKRLAVHDCRSWIVRSRPPCHADAFTLERAPGSHHAGGCSPSTPNGALVIHPLVQRPSGWQLAGCRRMRSWHHLGTECVVSSWTCKPVHPPEALIVESEAPVAAALCALLASERPGGACRTSR